MRGIFYDRTALCLHLVEGVPHPDWTLISHNLDATPNQCRRVLRELLTIEDLARVNWSGVNQRRAA
ncbi:MAG: hypothetical protein ACKVT1_13575 [Dehalococcoidia bacterium]